MNTLDGTWPKRFIGRAFVDGAKWWELASRGATMWNSDIRLAEIEAEKRYAHFYYYVIVHEHKHGKDIIAFKSKENLEAIDNQVIAKKLDIEYEPEYEEYLNIIEITPDCVEISC